MRLIDGDAKAANNKWFSNAAVGIPIWEALATTNLNLLTKEASIAFDADRRRIEQYLDEFGVRNPYAVLVHGEGGAYT